MKAKNQMHGIQMENNEKMHVKLKKKCTVFKIALSLKLTLSVPVLLSLSVPVSFLFQVYTFYFSGLFSLSGSLSTFYFFGDTSAHEW